MTWHLRIKGQVQGVGFRPFVRKMALERHLHGSVLNAPDGVHIQVNASREEASAFLLDLVNQAPRLARITHYSLEPGARPELFRDFSISHSLTATAPDLLLSPDFALCEACKQDFTDPANRRAGYAFTTCTNCGPRFSISQTLPYDRQRTTMEAFAMCEACSAEYNDPDDRRYFSQTNSCPDCGVSLAWLSGQPDPNPLATACSLLKKGKIVAVKGIGGFLLLCDATNAGAISTLRARKHRPAKPLAVMYAGTAQLAGDLEVSAGARELLEGPVGPIVLLPLREQPASGICHELLAPGLDRLGAMLPCAPLLFLISEEMGRPLVATSGNLSGSPICHNDSLAEEYLSPVADAILTHNREILVPQDDSVMVMTSGNRPLLLRRSRGLAPTFLPPAPLPTGSVLALGAQLKGCFAWQHRANMYLSPYLGDLDHPEVQLRFDAALQHFQQLLGSSPEALVCDLHPDYFTTQQAEALSRNAGIPLYRVQHHEAHAAAVLGEHALWESPDPVLVLVWDGTGLGTDGQVWGGECFLWKEGTLIRVASWEPFEQMFGDKMAREPRLSAWSLCRYLPGAEAALAPKFSEAEWRLYQQHRPGTSVLTSSMGRLFDAVASLAGLGDRVSFEGEAAMKLEAAARGFLRKQGNASQSGGYDLGEQLFPSRRLLELILQEVAEGRPAGEVALRFHQTLVQCVARAARQFGCRKLAFSGGVFQNALLCELIRQGLNIDFLLYFPEQLSPNDESIAFGQLQHLTFVQPGRQPLS